jgi:hypothetical protein
MLFFLQVISFIPSRLPKSLYLVVAGSNALSDFTLAGPECFFQDWDFEDTFTLTICVPSVLVVLVLIVYFVGSIIIRNRKIPYTRVFEKGGLLDRWSMRCFRSVAFLLYVVYMEISTIMLVPLSCTHDPGLNEDYFNNVPYLKCNPNVIGLAVLSLVVYVIGLPLLAVILVRRGMLSESLNTVFFSCYRPDQRRWELLVLCRRILLVLAFLLIPQNSAFLALAVSFLLAVSLFLQVWYAPFVNALDNAFESVSLIILILSFSASLQYGNGGVSQTQELSVLFFAVHCAFFACCIVAIVQRVQWKELAQALIGFMSVSETMTDRHGRQKEFEQQLMLFD